jgi:hypothetical protein
MQIGQNIPTGSRATPIIVVCVVLTAATVAIAFLAGSSSAARPVSLGRNTTVDIRAIRGRRLPRDARCGTFVPVLPQLATYAVTAHCGPASTSNVLIDRQGGLPSGCTYVTRIPPAFWGCRADNAHVDIRSDDTNRSIAEKRLREAVALVLKVGQARQ